MSRYRRAVTPGGTFFFTVTLADRKSTRLTDHIDLLRTAYRDVRAELPFETIAVCILPDHLHAVWRLPPGDHDFSTRWQRIKAGFSRHFAAAPRGPSKRRRGEKGIWQRRFWEHRVRDDIDLQRHVDYVHYNPVKHGLVGRVSDWPYSSFQRCVRRGTLSRDWAGGAAKRMTVAVGE